jgi:YHS domain-containing protein
MAQNGSLEQRVQELLAKRREAREGRLAETERRMSAILEGERRRSAVWKQLFDAIIRPKLELLVRTLAPKQGAQGAQASTCRAWVVLPPTEAFPNVVRVTLHLGEGSPPDARAVLRFEVSVAPILSGFEPASMLDLALDSPGLDEVASFLDERIFRFVSDCLRLEESESPYQVGRLVVDPMCGMSFSVAEAADVLRVGAETEYFCSKVCKEEFARRKEQA